jgi:hypothetical protein
MMLFKALGSVHVQYRFTTKKTGQIPDLVIEAAYHSDLVELKTDLETKNMVSALRRL